jgi:hypothetical protein
MNLIRFDSLGGASGDMILGALMSLGVTPAEIEGALRDLVPDEFHLSVEAASDRGLNGTRLTVHVHEHGHGHGHHAPHRTFADIRSMIDRSSLPDEVRRRSTAVFRRLAEAEGRVHGRPADEVHFHEVGAVDSIVDIVGACWAMHRLGVGGALIDSLPLGTGGTVECAHGAYPLPAPATADLLKNVPVRFVDETVETVTPTGAAFLVEWRVDPPPDDVWTIRGAGCGFGHRALKTSPNVLRAIWLERAPDTAGNVGDCLLLETNLDDCPPEWAGALMGRLLDAGALDVFFTPVQMKKQRPGFQLSVLCEPAAREAMLDIVFRESTTLGIREHTVRRTILDRTEETVQTPHGPVRVKTGYWKGEAVSRKPEFEDCARLAAQAGVAVKTVVDAARERATT